jgi:hypothetical protein
MAMYGVGPVAFESVSSVTATPSVEAGVVREEGDEKYIYVYNAGNSQIIPGNCAVASAVTGYSVTVSSTTMIDSPIGICKHTTLTTGTYGWLLVRGFGPAKAPANSGLAAGQLLCAGGDGVLAVKSISTDAPAPVVGKVMVATASAGVADAFYRIF